MFVTRDMAGQTVACGDKWNWIPNTEGYILWGACIYMLAIFYIQIEMLLNMLVLFFS